MRTTIYLLTQPLESKIFVSCEACTELVDVDKAFGLIGKNRPAICREERDWQTTFRDHAQFRRCVDDPDERDQSKLAAFPAPTEAGFYWAEWRVCEDGTADEDSFHPITLPEVVDVFVNQFRDRGPDDLRVHVSGVAASQGLDCFVWRSARLPRPEESRPDVEGM